MVPRQLEEPGERVPICSAPSAGNCQWARRIGRYELHQDPLRPLRGNATELIARVEQGGEALAMPTVGKEDVHEARSCDLDALGTRPQAGSELLAQQPGDLPR